MGYNYKFTDREIALYKKEKALAETKRVDITNACLVAFRRKNMFLQNIDPNLRAKFLNLNKTVSGKPIEQVLKVINYWIEGENITSPKN